MLVIRAEEAADADAVRQVNLEAFGQRAEADLVEALRFVGKNSVSLVTTQEGRVVGHILFSPVSIDSAQGTKAAVGLAPMAVLPRQQRQGVGSERQEASTRWYGCRPVRLDRNRRRRY